MDYMGWDEHINRQLAAAPPEALTFSAGVEGKAGSRGQSRREIARGQSRQQAHGKQGPR